MDQRRVSPSCSPSGPFPSLNGYNKTIRSTRRLPRDASRRSVASEHRRHVRPQRYPTNSPAPDDDDAIPRHILPPTSRLRSRHSTRLGLRHALGARALNKRHPRQQQQQQRQPNHDRGHPPIHEPGIVPQPAGCAPRRRGDVHVRDVPAVQDDRARV